MICVCGKAAMDGVKCKFGALHMSLKQSRAQRASDKPKVERERLAPVKRERLDAPKQARLFL